MKFIKGPDFPTGCMVCGLEVIKEYFTTGPRQHQGARQGRRRTTQGRREQIVITEIPYNVNRAVLVERIADLVNEKRSSPTSRPCATNRTKTRAWSSNSSATPSPRWSSTIFTSTPRWNRVLRQHAGH
jgi:DNA gyrase/topoisomerase IV subunit A